METFGDRLRHLRGERTQKEVAEELGMPPTTLSTLENQAAPPRGEVLLKLATHFKVPVDYFYKTTAGQLRASDSARAWLRHLQEPAKGKDTVATQATVQLDEHMKERIAERMRRKHAEASDDK